MKRPFWFVVYVRYFSLLFWEFRRPLTLFWGIVLLGGLVIAPSQDKGYFEACHGVFLLIFLESALSFPEEWYLKPFFFLVPILGLGAVADSLVRLAYLTFTRKQNLPEWQRMVASLYREHIIVVGVGKVGLQLIRELVELDESIVAIEIEKTSEFIDAIKDLGVPLITGDARQPKTLEFAGVSKAKTIIVVTDDDLTNLDSALTAQNINPDIRVVLRLYDETLGAKVRSSFCMPAISIAHVSAPSFISAATGKKVHQSFALGGKKLQLADLTVGEAGHLVGKKVGEVQREFGVNIVLLHLSGGVEVNPDHDVVLSEGDSMFVIASKQQYFEIAEANVRKARAKTKRLH